MSSLYLSMYLYLVTTNLSASPLNLEWYGDVRVQRIPLFKQNCWYSSLVNWGPLPETIWLGIPSLENRDRRISMVCSAVVLLFILTNSGHLVAASITISHVDPSNGSTKSMWRRFHGSVGFSHVCMNWSPGRFLWVFLAWDACVCTFFYLRINLWPPNMHSC